MLLGGNREASWSVLRGFLLFGSVWKGFRWPMKALDTDFPCMILVSGRRRRTPTRTKR